LLRELADAGHTVILITHDPQVAAQAGRVVKISDGRIVAAETAGDESRHCEGRIDAAIHAAVQISGAARRMERTGLPRACGPRNDEALPVPCNDKVFPAPRSDGEGFDPRNFMARMTQGRARNASWLADVLEAVSSGWRTLSANRFRTLLTLLGIMIGVASVIVLMAVGQGASEKLLQELAEGGATHRISIWPGFIGTRGLRGQLFMSDLDLVREVEGVAHVSPFRTGSVILRAGNVDLRAVAYTTNSEAPAIFNWEMGRGVFFNREDERYLSTVIVLSKNVRQNLFGNENAIGRHVLVDNVPFLVIGELAETREEDDNKMVVFPFATASRRVWGTPTPASLQVRVRDPARVEETIADITKVLTAAHRVKDFEVANNPARVRAQNEAGEQQNLLLALIAGISLVVGGIGVMNIMLMAVKERTREIGIRMAVGARQRDIQRQFLTEAVMVSLVGGAIGVVMGLAVGAALIFWEVPVIFSVRAMLLAFGCAVVTGLVFGYMPARTAARLDPVVALGGE
jgi:macrolide transport system ATP-binding/permease protein